MNSTHHQTPEESLAEYTDRLLEGDNPTEPGTHPADPELVSLKGTVRRIHRHLPRRDPEDLLRRRMHDHLQGEYRREFNTRRSSWKESPSLQWGLVFGAAAVLVAAGLLAGQGEVTPGAAGGGLPAWIPLVVILGLAAVGLIVWRIRKK